MKPGLQTHMAIAHFAFDFRPWDQGGHRVDDDDIHRVGSHQHSSQISKACSPSIRLRHHQLIEFDSQPLGPGGIQGVLGINERRHSAKLLAIGDNVQRERGLTGGFWTEDFQHPSPREYPHRPGQCPETATRLGCHPHWRGHCHRAS